MKIILGLILVVACTGCFQKKGIYKTAVVLSERNVEYQNIIDMQRDTIGRISKENNKLHNLYMLEKGHNIQMKEAYEKWYWSNVKTLEVK
jgi:hypothetical protein